MTSRKFSHQDFVPQLSERAKREQYRAQQESKRLERLHKQAKRQYYDAGDGDDSGHQPERFNADL